MSPIIIAVAVFMVFLLAVLFYVKSPPLRLRPQSRLNPQNHFISQSHKYLKSKKTSLYFCNVCKKLLFGLCGPNSYECSVCGIFVHKKCRSNQIDCKYFTSKEQNSKLHHQWLKGNLSLNSVCSHCGQICGSFFDLEGKSCLWCQRVTHDECSKSIPLACDYGELADVIMEPTLEQKAKRPIFVVINQKSGGQSGQEFYKSFNRFLNPSQIINLTEEGLERLKSFRDYKNAKLIIAGGDGTVASVINFIREIDWNPPVAILPLGTGNDLSRAFGWGGTYETLDGQNILEQVRDNENVSFLDRWNINVRTNRKESNHIMFNYFGIGLDAKFCYDFHHLRIQSPELFKSRIGNKFIYTKMGLNDLFQGQKTGLGKKIRLICDGEEVQVPDQVENIIVLNINSWSGGVTNLWNPAEKSGFKPQRMNDGLLEVIGVSSILHLGQIQVGMNQPFQIAQGRRLEIVYKDKSHIQFDGEPIQVGPCQIIISFIDKVQMLSKIDQTMPNWENKFIKTMDWAQEEGLLTAQAKNQIVQRMLH